MSTMYYLCDNRLEEIDDYVKKRWGDTDIAFVQKIERILIDSMFTDEDGQELGTNNYYSGKYTFAQLKILCDSGQYSIVDEYSRRIKCEDFIKMHIKNLRDKIDF